MGVIVAIVPLVEGVVERGAGKEKAQISFRGGNLILQKHSDSQEEHETSFLSTAFCRGGVPPTTTIRRMRKRKERRTRSSFRLQKPKKRSDAAFLLKLVQRIVVPVKMKKKQRMMVRVGGST